ncbi:hypothetical protein [Aquimarina mytili]|uniref:Uncharacterized protein n=1 Tax=Aquimarina mytili TaxID=874423 RepID=A0A937A063_9FLAO|nr:hypothetical protein [Aquimarina mytili]MBL0685566.1 hypothetical protein [Aquimarina mytili]
MKNQKKDLKLVLSKQTISKLNSMSLIKGGGGNTASQNCGTSVQGKGCQADNTNYCDH